MQKTKFFLTAILLSALLFLMAGCASADNNSEKITAAKTDANIPLAGDWTATGHDLTFDRHFYSDGKSVTVIMDTEEDAWCYMGNWKEDGTNLVISNLKVYEYNPDDQKWKMDDTLPSTQTLTNYKMEQDSFTVNEPMTNGVAQSYTYKRGESGMDIPEESALLKIVNEFLK